MGKEQNGDVVSELETFLGLDDELDPADNNDPLNESTPPTTETQNIVPPVERGIVITKEQSDITKEIIKIDLLIEAAAENSVDMVEFYSTLDAVLSDEEQQLEFDDKPAYMKLVALKAKEYEAANSNTTQLEKLKADKDELEKLFERKGALAEVSLKYPDFDAEKVFEFYDNHLTKSQQAAIYEGATSYQEVYENTYKLFLAANPSSMDVTPVPAIPKLNNVRKQNISDTTLEHGMDSDENKLRSALGLD